MSESIALKIEPRPVPEMSQIIDRKLYRTEGATCLAQTNLLMGWSWLMKTPKGAYFAASDGPLLDQRRLAALTADQAKDSWISATLQFVEWEDAFGEPLEEA